MPNTQKPLSPPRERRNFAARRALVERVYGEFHEMPCLRLTPAQARRLFDLRADVSQRILQGLVAEGVLTRDGERFRLNELSLASGVGPAPATAAVPRRRAS